MADDALQTVRLRNDFYRDNYRRLTVAVLLLLVVVIMLGSLVYYQASHRPYPQYFATTQDGRIIKIIPLSQPLLPQKAVLQFAAEAAMSAYTFDFINYRDQLQDAEVYFTHAGFNELKKGMARNLKAVVAKQLVVTSVPGRAPIVLFSGIQSDSRGRFFAWKIQMPLLVTYTSSSEKISNTLMVNMVVRRVSTLTTPRGIAVDQINYKMVR